MKVDQLGDGFPDDVPVPDALVSLCEYAERVGPAVCCDFALTDCGQQYASSWFDGDDSTAREFVVFGVDGAQSLYACWRYDGRPIEAAPVVYLESEGSGSRVLADSLESFLSLLALGWEEIGRVESWGEQQEPCANVEAYRNWLREELSLTAPTDGRAVVERAREGHPDLDEYVQRWIREHG